MVSHVKPAPTQRLKSGDRAELMTTIVARRADKRCCSSHVAWRCGCLGASLRPCFTRRNARPASAKLQLRGRANWPASILTIRVRLTFCNTANQPGTLTMQGGALPLSYHQFDGPSSAAHCLAWAVAAALTANTHARETARATYLSVSATR